MVYCSLCQEGWFGQPSATRLVTGFACEMTKKGGHGGKELLKGCEIHYK